MSAEPAPGSSRPTVPFLIAVVAVIVVGLIAFQIAGGLDHDTTTSLDDEEAAAPIETPTTEVGDDDLVDVGVDAGDLRLDFLLPPRWVDIAPGSGVPGAQRFPSDPELAEAYDRAALAAIEQGAILFAIDPDLSARASARVFYNPPREGETFEDAIASGRQIVEEAAGVVKTADEPVRLSGGMTGHLLRYDTPTTNGVRDNIQILIPAQGGSFVLLALSTNRSVIDELINLAPSIEVS